MSGISIGTNIRTALLDSEAVTAITCDAYPVARDTARLPYIVYTLTGLDESKYKEGHYDIVTVDLDCYGVDYDSAVALAEAARDAVEGANHYGMRSCYLSNMRTGATGDAYFVTLTLTIKIA